MHRERRRSARAIGGGGDFVVRSVGVGVFIRVVRRWDAGRRDEFAKEFGVASGGKYGDEKGCAAYPFPPCHHPCHATDAGVPAEIGHGTVSRRFGRTH